MGQPPNVGPTNQNQDLTKSLHEEKPIEISKQRQQIKTLNKYKKIVYGFRHIFRFRFLLTN